MVKLKTSTIFEKIKTHSTYLPKHKPNLNLFLKTKTILKIYNCNYDIKFQFMYINTIEKIIFLHNFQKKNMVLI